MGEKLIRLIASLTLALSAYTYAAASNIPTKLGPEHLYAKCFARLTDHPVDYNSADYKKVAAGQLDPVTACMQTFDRARLVAKNGRLLLNNGNDEIARSILRNFHQFHNSWISRSIYPIYYTYLTYGVREHAEDALFVTRALFANMNFKSIVTSRGGIRSFRLYPSPENFLFMNVYLNDFWPTIGPMLPGRHPAYEPGNARIIDLKEMRVGPMVGIEPMPSTPFPYSRIIAPENYGTVSLVTSQNENKVGNLADHFGGGVLGTPIRFMNYSESGTHKDGGINIHRRWANAFFNDFMCLTFPTLTYVGANSDVKPDMEAFKNSELAFRKEASCLACHSSLDNFAHAARNVATYLTAVGYFTNEYREHKPGERVMGFMSAYLLTPRLSANLIAWKPEDFGSGFSPYEIRVATNVADCKANPSFEYACLRLRAINDAPNSQGLNARREAWRAQACYTAVSSHPAMLYAIKQVMPNASLAAAPEINEGNIMKAFQLFFRSQDLAEPEVMDAIQIVSQDESTLLNKWKSIFLTLCLSPHWQVL